MKAEDDVLLAANRRARALARGDREQLQAVLHPMFVWTSHRGDRFDRAAYLDANIAGRTAWHHQQLNDVEIHVVGDVAILRCVVHDDVTTPAGRESFVMPMTTTWIRDDSGWLCLAGHAGPRMT